MAKLKGMFNGFWRYRYLLWNLVSRDFKLKYRRSVLGVLWSVLNPLLMCLVYWAVFSSLMDMRGSGIDKEFVQDNQSRSTRGVLRGLHFQKEHTQGKLVRVTKGEVYDVAVDCRPHSATFGKWVGVTLSEDNKKMFYIPEGFAHGFLVLSDVAEFCYKCTDVYDPTSEGGIPYDDPTVNVQWPDCGCEHKTSAKDKLHEPFAAQKFEYFEKW